MIPSALFLSLALVLTGCAGAQDGEKQARPDLYQCEGCGAVFERDPDTLTSSSAIMIPDGEPGEPMVLTGTVYQTDGSTPAEGIIIYAYQTDAEGLYSRGTDETRWSRRHGLLRAWVKTGADGTYRFETIRPGPYPGRTDPAHIHLTVLEPDRMPYWIDDVVFTDDPLVDADYRRARSGQGGNGIVTPSGGSETGWYVQRDIILERHPD